MLDEDDDRPGNRDHAGGPLLVALTGCSGSGKSTLLAALARRGHQVVPEAGRQVVREHMQIDGPALPWRDAGAFVDLAVSRAMAQFNAARPGGRPVIFDRTVVDLVCFLAHRGLATPDHLRRVLAIYRYAPQVLATPPWEAIYADDGERRKSFAEALAEHETTIAAYRSLGYRIVEVPRAPVAERVAFVEAVLAAR